MISNTIDSMTTKYKVHMSEAEIKNTYFMRTLFSFVLCSLILSCSSAQPSIKLSENNPVISLERSACYGKCPAYTLTLFGNGKAIYKGESNVEKMGTHTATISESDILLLVKEFEKVKFFELKNVYDAMVTDIPTYTVKYTLNGTSKTVADRFGAPNELRDLERKIDEIADKLQWTKGDN